MSLESGEFERRTVKKQIFQRLFREKFKLKKR